MLIGKSVAIFAISSHILNGERTKYILETEEQIIGSEHILNH